MKFSFSGTENPDELKIAINNLGLRIAFVRETTEGRPVIIYFGDTPFSQKPNILVSLHLFKNENKDKCVVFCGAVLEDNNTVIPIELRISSRDVKAFVSDNILFVFCDKIEKIEGDNIMCNKERTIVIPNSLNKDVVRKLVEEMKNPGDEMKAWDNYLKTYPYPPCLGSFLHGKVRF
jgi:hypothetical protein